MNEELLELVSNILGPPLRSNDATGQYAFDCPVCSYEIKNLDEGDGKANLELNINSGLFNCWVCGEEHGTKGTISKLIRKFGNRAQRRLYNTMDIDFEVAQKKPQEEGKRITLPSGYMFLHDVNPRMIEYKQAMRYLEGRGITDEMIIKYRIGMCADGEYSGRIIIPSFDSTGKLNYFIGRTWYEAKNKYKNPDTPKETIIFNESNVDFNKDIHLCEGVFDMVFLDNPIPLLGKYLSQKLHHKLYTEAKGDIFIAMDGEAWGNSMLLYNELNSGNLYGRIKLLKLPIDEDPATLRGKVDQFFFEVA